mmetsp:Transcript_4845/g.9490  ORF Transcript_4845/g.9490 Transcript_4845/m.9490 type:complete len:284 (-) Transcript_4845:899-1750(-)
MSAERPNRRNELDDFMNTILPRHVAAVGQFLPASIRLALVSTTERLCETKIREPSEPFRVDEGWEAFFEDSKRHYAAGEGEPEAMKPLRAIVDSLVHCQRHMDSKWYHAALQKTSEYCKAAGGPVDELRPIGTLAEIRALVLFACARCSYFIALGEPVESLSSRITPEDVDKRQPNFLPRMKIQQPSCLKFAHAVKHAKDYVLDEKTTHLKRHLDERSEVFDGLHPFYSLTVVPFDNKLAIEFLDMFYLRDFMNLGHSPGRCTTRSQIETVAMAVTQAISCAF